MSLLVYYYIIVTGIYIIVTEIYRHAALQWLPQLSACRAGGIVRAPAPIVEKVPLLQAL